MAEMKQKAVKQNGLELVTSVKDKVEIQHKKRQVDARIQELAEKTADIIQTQGYDSSLAQIMMTFLDAALMMQETVKLVEGMNLALGYLGDMVGFIEGSLNFQNKLFEQFANAKSFNFIERIKMKSNMNKMIKNASNQMQAMFDQIKSVQGVMRMFSKEMTKFSQDMDKINKKQNISSTAGSTRARTLVEERIKAKGGNLNNSNNNSSNNSSNNNSPKDTGLDGII